MSEVAGARRCHGQCVDGWARALVQRLPGGQHLLLQHPAEESSAAAQATRTEDWDCIALVQSYIEATHVIRSGGWYSNEVRQHRPDQAPR